MRVPLPEVRALTRQLFEHQQGGQAPTCREDATEHILHIIAEGISPLVGIGGFEMLLARALRKAQQEHDVLLPVRVGAGDGRHLSGLQEVAQRGNAEEVEAAMEAVVAELIGLIARFLGADMAIRLVRHSLPAPEDRSRRPRTEETNHG